MRELLILWYKKHVDPIDKGALCLLLIMRRILILRVTVIDMHSFCSCILRQSNFVGLDKKLRFNRCTRDENCKALRNIATRIFTMNGNNVLWSFYSSYRFEFALKSVILLFSYRFFCFIANSVWQIIATSDCSFALKILCKSLRFVFAFISQFWPFNIYKIYITKSKMTKITNLYRTASTLAFKPIMWSHIELPDISNSIYL